MAKDSALVDMVRVLEIRIKRNTLAMQSLLYRFHDEFGFVPGYSGWVLHLHMCGKKGCTSCPHRIGWVYYSWLEGTEKPWFDNRIGFRTKLPGSFFTLDKKRWESGDPIVRDPRNKPRKKGVAERFKRYQWTIDSLNRERRKLMNKRKRISLMLNAVNMPKQAVDLVGEAPLNRFKKGTGKSKT